MADRLGQFGVFALKVTVTVSGWVFQYNQTESVSAFFTFVMP